MENRIRSRRKALKITQDDLGRRIGVTKATVSLWENGTNQPNGANLQKLAASLQCTPRWILTGKGAEDNPPLMLSEANPIFQIPLIGKQDIGKLLNSGLVNIKHKFASPEVAASLGASRETFAYIETSTGMMPKIAPDDMVYIDPKKQLTPDSKGIYLFRVGAGYQLGTVGSTPTGIVLRFDSNEAGWDSISVSEDDYIGRVVAYIPAWLL